jgi:hypothetical protein
MDRRIQAMAERVAKSVEGGDRDEAMEKVDEAVDAIIAALMSLEENLPQVKTDSVPEKAAVDTVISLLNEAVKPYMADVAKALDVFER